MQMPFDKYVTILAYVSDPYFYLPAFTLNSFQTFQISAKNALTGLSQVRS